MDIAASWGAPGSTPRYAYSPQCFTGPPGTSPHLGSMLRLPSFGRGSSSRDTPSARRRQGTLSREPSVHSVAEAGGGASPGGPAGAGRRAGAADVDTDMPFALDESSHAAPGAPASPGSGAGAMVGAEGRVSVAAAAASPGSGRRGAGREPASAREVSVLLRMFQEAPVIGKSSGPPMGEAMREVERYRCVLGVAGRGTCEAVLARVRGARGRSE